MKIILFKELPHGTAIFFGCFLRYGKGGYGGKGSFCCIQVLHVLLVRPAGWSKGYPFNYGFGPWDGGKGMMMGAYGGMMMPPMPLACLLGRFFSKSCWLSSDQTSIPLSHIKSLSHDTSGVVISISAESQFFWPLRFGFKGKGKGKGKSPLKVAMNSAQNQSQMVPLYWIQQKEQGCIDQHLQKHLSLIWVSDFDTGWNHLKGGRVWRKSMDSFIRCQSVLTWTEVGSGKLIASLHFLSHNCDSGSGKEGVDWQHPWGLHFEWKSL